DGTGNSSTNGLPVTADAFKTTTNGDDFYFVILEKGIKSLLYATFFGENSPARGNHVDGGTCRFDKRGIIYHAACACGGSSGFPTTPGVVSNRNNSSNCNAVGFKFDLGAVRADFNIIDQAGNIVTSACSPAQIRFQNLSTGGDSYEWKIDTLPIIRTRDANFTFNNTGEFKITLKVLSRLACKEITITKILKIGTAIFATSPDTKICLGENTQLSASGGDFYNWLPSETLSSSTSPTPTATPDKTTEYTVKITNRNGCEITKKIKVEVENIGADFDLILTTTCDAPPSVQLVNKTGNADDFVWSMGNGDTLRGKEPQTYTYTKPGKFIITLTAGKGRCLQTKSREIIVEEAFVPSNAFTPNQDSTNETYVLPQKGWKLEVYNRWGKLIYEAADYQNDWGKKMDAGNYYYLITTPGGRRCKGWLHVLK
ncbi:MAG: gliding motility-associated C-terminal domain-containing protein, partial [Verrucomicrobia bacterium]|nr:gliding motility-associated C-terminal domain-containing protein [Cytophagales bacterium]